jgi:hypothetical protein
VSTARAILLALVTAACAAPAAADAPAVSVEVDARTVRADQPLTVTIAIEGAGADRARLAGRPPASDKLQPAGAPAVSSQMTFVNGVMSASRTLRLTYVPTGVGETRVPSFAIEVGDQVVRTDPVPVTIVPADGAGPPAGNDAAATDRSDPRLRMRTRLDRTEVYIGEELLLEYVLQDAGANPRDVDPDRLDPIPGFLVEDEPVDAAASARRTQRDGRQWTEYTLFRRHLTPTRTGTITIPPVAFEVAVPARGRDPFGLGFGSLRSFRSVPVVAPAREVTVRPLPEQGRPAGFDGAVGRFELSGTLDDPRPRAGGAANLELTVTGEGALGALEPPRLEAPADVQVYPPVEAEAGANRRRWIYPLVPRSPGRVELAGARLHYFDPRAARYEQAQAGPFVLDVQEAAAGAVTGGGTPVEAGAEDLRYLLPAPAALVDAERTPLDAAWFWTLALLPVLVLPALALAGQVLARRAGSAAGRRARTLRRAREHLREARRTADDPPAAARAVLQALHLWATEVLGEPTRPLERGRLRRTLVDRTGDAGLADRVVDLLDRAEAARYGAGEDPSLVEDAERLVGGGR